MDLAIEAKHHIFEAIHASFLKIYPDSTYPEIITKKVMEFTVLIKKFDKENENFATHIVECPIKCFGAMKECWDFVVFTLFGEHDWDLSFTTDIPSEFQDWSQIFFIDNVSPSITFEVTEENEDRFLFLDGWTVCNFNNFNFENISRGCTYPITTLECSYINFDVWEKVKFPANVLRLSFAQCQISESLLYMENLKYLDIESSQVDWSLFQLPKQLERLRIKDSNINWKILKLPKQIEFLSVKENKHQSQFPEIWDLRKMENLTSLIIQSVVQKSNVHVLFPGSLLCFNSTGLPVTHPKIDRRIKKNRRLKIKISN